MIRLHLQRIIKHIYEIQSLDRQIEYLKDLLRRGYKEVGG